MSESQSSVRVIDRWRVRTHCEAAFVQAWTNATTLIRDTVPGARCSLLLRCQVDSQLFLSIARWDSLEDWENFWKGDPPDSEAFATMHATSHLLSREVFYEIEDDSTDRT
ncbi:MAG: antibiotic biosynthesis monooxygenase [Cyanobacteria bacterium SID2]|nr:antibiotic biosynthesis monooxygenase [Cyanobacteria bacterium SID2]MBP0004721.1 antibiotic biosynthesis monooxygenase [Cyanobacteria bacterium SBC]